ncbi:MAG: CBS domain-containing protein [Desulfofustis sp.]|nr:CBS domain-containing protein [Desulfofustis sp.]RZW25432.1 MAG: CBS domain-containing protein [Desulfobulbaceae bacterium]MBT8353251.1 CBS domain-containing protein [Desulfofustis sp.]NNF47028.1 CBS domain-containing protein [Desulfofustis sp.]NNK14689.1 CBS domain-containing protein [Desulfofustis sp.]
MKTARDIMTKDVITVRPETLIRELAEIFLEQGISGVPVVSADDKVIGIATESDLIFHSKRLKVPTVLTILDSFIFLDSPEKMERELRKIGAASVSDVYTSPPLTITPDTQLDEIASLMTEKQVHTLPVLDDEGKMIGIVGKKDIIRTIL